MYSENSWTRILKCFEGKILLAGLIKVWVVRKEQPGYFVQEKKKKSTRKLLRKFCYKPGLIYGTMG